MIGYGMIHHLTLFNCINLLYWVYVAIRNAGVINWKKDRYFRYLASSATILIGCFCWFGARQWDHVAMGWELIIKMTCRRLLPLPLFESTHPQTRIPLVRYHLLTSPHHHLSPILDLKISTNSQLAFYERSREVQIRGSKSLECCYDFNLWFT